MEQAIEKADQTAWAQADSRFHTILSAHCSNKLLGEIVLQVRTRIFYVSVSNHADHGRMFACTKEHREVVEAIAAREPSLAEQKMRDHLSKLQESFFKRLTYPKGTTQIGIDTTRGPSNTEGGATY
jgi:DNA-binding FadR family transcriptional regulator